ncbi:hypothetical protein J6590_102058, partial [Homalodisca vitripennis]
LEAEVTQIFFIRIHSKKGYKCRAVKKSVSEILNCPEHLQLIEFRIPGNGRAVGTLTRTGSLCGHPSKQQSHSMDVDSVIS